MPGPTIGELAAGITLDTSRFEKGIVATKTEIRDAGRVVAAAQTPLENYAQQVAKLDDYLRRGLISQNTYAKAVENADRAFRSASPAVDDVGKKTGLLGGVVSRVVPTIDVANLALKAFSVAADFARSAIQGAIEQAEEIDRIAKFADTIGFSTEALAGLEYSAGLSGASVESLKTGLTKFSVAVGNSSKEFGKLGLSVQDLQRMAPEDAFYKTVDALNAIQNPAERAAIAVKIFGKGAIDLIPLFAEGSEGLKKMAGEAGSLGLAFGRVDAEGVERANDAFSKLGALWDGLGRTIAIEFAPLVESLAEVLLDVGQEGMKSASVIEDAAKVSAIALRELLDLVSDLKAVFDLLASSPGVKELFRLSETLEKMTGASGIDTLANAFNPLAAIGKAARALTGGGDTLGDSLEDKLASPATDAAEKKVGGAMANLAGAGDDLAEEAERIAKDVQTPMERLAETLEKLNAIQEQGLLDEEKISRAKKAAYEQFDKESGVNEAAEAIQKVRDRLADNLAKEDERVKQEGLREAERTVADNLTPFEKLQQEGERLADLFDEGLIDQDTYTRAAAKATDDFLKKITPPELESINAADRSSSSVARGTADALKQEFYQKNPQIQQQLDIQIQMLNEQRKTNQALKNGVPTVSLGL